jgi:hypothetical protein
VSAIDSPRASRDPRSDARPAGACRRRLRQDVAHDPGGRYELKNISTGQSRSGRIAYPAKLFRNGLVVDVLCPPGEILGGDIPCTAGDIYRRVDLHTVRQRVIIAYGGLAAAIALVGFGLAALLRPRPRPRPDSWPGPDAV